MNLLATRNFRVVLALVALLTVVVILVTQRKQLTPAVPHVNTVHTPDVFDTAPVDEPQAAKVGEGNTPPYPKQDALKADKLADAGSVADKLPQKPQGTTAAKPELKNNKPDSKGSESKGSEVKTPASKQPQSGDCEQYVIMIDAGLLGLRVHTYKFDVCQLPPRVLAEDFKMLKPGLSSFDTDAAGAANSLNPLLDQAVLFVPQHLQLCTPVAVKATAGLRKLGEEKSLAILAAVRSHLETLYPFAVVEGTDGIEVMEGLDEGYYAWITTNLLLGTIGTEEKEATAAVFDLGGGLTQIVFEPKPGHEVAKLSMKREFEFAGHTYSLYEYSHLGYGLNEARNKINKNIVANHGTDQLTKHQLAKQAEAAAADAVEIVNVCMPPNTQTQKVVEFAKDEFYHVKFVGGKLHLGGLCRGLVELIFAKDAECSDAPCSFNGVHQPLLTKSFDKHGDMYVFSFFYDRTNPLGFPLDFTVEELRDLARDVCGGAELASVFAKEAKAELDKEPLWCMDLSIITGLLHTGYDIPLSREVKTAQKIGGFEIGWCLGASLPLLELKGKNWKCRA